MRRPVLMVGLVALAAVVLPVPALADDLLGCASLPMVADEGPAPLGPGPCPGVRPGGRVVTSVGDCTLNFLFRAPDGTRYIGTAGHCADPGGASNEESNPDGRARIERVWSFGKGPVAADSDGQRFGEFAYAVVQPSRDFALIRLDPDVTASPEMCHFGAPRGLYSTDTAAAVVLRYYGNGERIGDVAPARTAVALGTPDPDHIHAAGAGCAGRLGRRRDDRRRLGDRSPRHQPASTASDGNHAIPTTSHTRPRRCLGPIENGVDVGTMGITRLGPQLARASEKLGVSLELVTAR